jgi:hypothetical protein
MRTVFPRLAFGGDILFPEFEEKQFLFQVNINSERLQQQT